MISEIIRADLHGIISDTNIPWEEFKNRTLLVTGATGLIGGALVRALSEANEQHGLKLRIIACGRNKEKNMSTSVEYDTEFIFGDIRNSESFLNISGNIDYIFHCAAITKSADMVSTPVDLMTTSVYGTHNMLELARVKSCRSFVYLSSMEVYGQGLDGDTDETKIGCIDLSNPRSSYPESKRFCEMLCISYVTQYNLPVKTVRLAQTFGAGTSKDDMRVFAQFARSAMNAENIILHTEGMSRGNYCYISDSVRGLLTVLLKGKNGEAYNIANPAASATIREMAELVAKEIGGKQTEVVVDIPENIKKLGYATAAEFTLNVDKLMALGWQPQFGLGEMYRRLIDDWSK